MRNLIGMIYEPPEMGLPWLAVVIARNGDIMAAQTAPTRSKAAQLLSDMRAQFQSEGQELA